MGTISFQAKQDSRAIQLADLFAYYSRRHVRRIEEHPAPFDDEGKLRIEPEPLLAILESLPNWFRVARDVDDSNTTTTHYRTP